MNINGSFQIDRKVISPIATFPTLDPTLFQSVTRCFPHWLPVLSFLINARCQPAGLELPSMLIHVLAPCDAQHEVDIKLTGILPDVATLKSLKSAESRLDGL